jgi:hypothetical protein
VSAGELEISKSAPWLCAQAAGRRRDVPFLRRMNRLELASRGGKAKRGGRKSRLLAGAGRQDSSRNHQKERETARGEDWGHERPS